MPNKPLNPEDFLAHADFVRSLVRILVSDEHAGQDVIQDTWLAALKSPPTEHRSVRAWLSHVARNLSANLRRGNFNRNARERIAAIPDSLPSTDEIVSFEEERRRVVDALLELDEPFRTAIILRYYHDLPPRDISRRMSVPIETTRSRLKRGLFKLRDRLDRDYNGDRNGWVKALAPLAGISIEQTAASSATTAGVATSTVAVGKTLPMLLSGGLVMNAKFKIAAATILLIGVVAVVSGILFLEPGSSGESVSTDEIVFDLAPHDSGSDAESTGEITAPEPGPDASREKLAADAYFIEGQVIDKVTRQPVRAFHLNTRLRKQDASGERRVINETIEDPEGRFRIPVDAGGTFLVMFHSSRHITTSWYKVEVPSSGGGADLLVELDPGETVRGRVVDDDTDEPVQGALVTFNSSSTNDTPLLWFLEGFREYHPNATSGSEGRFTLEGFNRRYLWAYHPDYAAAHAKVGNEETILRLKKGFRVYGRVYDDDGAPAEGVMVRIGNYSHFSGRLGIPALTDSNGFYRTPPTEPGTATLYAGPPGMEFYNPGPWPEHPRFTPEWKVVEIADEDVEVNFGIASEYVTWQGRLLDAQKNPVPSSTIRVEMVTPLFDCPARRPETDSEGRFTMKKLVPGTYEIQVSGRGGWTLHRWKSYYLGPPGEIVQDLEIPGVSVRGVVVDSQTGQPITGDGGYVSIDPVVYSEGSSKNVSIDEQGRFEVVGLPAGVYSLYVRYHSVGHGMLSSVAIPRDDPFEEVVIPLTPVGRLSFKLEGFDSSQDQDFTLRFYCENEKRASHGFGNVSKWIKEKPVYEMLPGKLMLTFFFTNLGSAEKECTIRSGEPTVISLNAAELQGVDREIELTGTLLHADGNPFRGIEMTLIGHSVPGWTAEDHWVRATTDHEGRFGFSGLKPGEWSVRARTEEGDTYYFDKLYIPPDSGQQLAMNLSISTGVVTGSLRDSKTGQKLNHDHGYWSVSLYSLETKNTAIRCVRKKGPCEFSLKGLKPGSYRLHARAEGYTDAYVDSIRVMKDTTVAIGSIDLEPNGRLELLVEDPDGQPVTTHQVTGLVPPLSLASRQYVLDGRYRYESLPIGPLTLRVTAEGFNDFEFTVNITPKKMVEERVVLKRE